MSYTAFITKTTYALTAPRPDLILFTFHFNPLEVSFINILNPLHNLAVKWKTENASMESFRCT